MEQHILEKLKENVERTKKVLGFAEEIKKELEKSPPKVEETKKKSKTK